ncbi:MAG: Do family serine endopeptidase [Bacteroidales bacterium]|jgi:Do/DeqQ family serine protease|nr:Do family serine endopeptidase [Bacteroidales bacterium]MCI1785938.1 Do family serine endopeptidase [Bacteroidales bacterium]
MKKNILIVVLSVLLSGFTAFFVVKAVTSHDVTGATAALPDGAQYRTVSLENTDYPDFTYAAESALDAVVYVDVTMKTPENEFQIDPFFKFFFGGQQPGGPVERASGSGVIIRPDGYIVTNNHVVENATKIEVTLTNKKTFEAKVIGTDPATDVALIKIDAEGLPTIPFGDSDKLRLGEWVLAIGSPLGLQGTITAGIVSAKGRSMPSDGKEFKIESFIQTDAAVNPGNSGGALVNKAGELVGINTAIVSQTGSYSGYSFAVPSDIVKKVVSDLIDFGTVKRAFLGIVMTPMNDKIAKDLKLSSLNGVYIKEVAKGSAAEKAGMKSGDVILAIDSVKVNDGSVVQEMVNNYRPGDKAEFTVVRNGKEKVLDVTFMGTSAANGSVDSDGNVAFYGSKLGKVSKETLERLGLKHGVEVTSVGPGKMMNAGASEGFVILFVNDMPVSKPRDVVEIASKARRSIVIEGVTANGQSDYFAFGKNK